MADYIRRDIVLKIINTVNDTGGFAGYADYCTLFDEIDTMPAADVQPVKRGEWKHVAGMNSKCSVCSHYFPVSEFDSRPFDINFCPNCGARMDGDAE